MQNTLSGLLKDLKTNIAEIQHIMVDVSTNGSHTIPDCEKRYEELYYTIESVLTKLENYNIKMVHINNFPSLWDYYSYWKADLPTYDSRRVHVRSLYKEMEKQIIKNLTELSSSDHENAIVNAELYLDIENVPDDFYRQLINLINECYSKGIYVAVPIFSRKLLESLIVDIFKKKYGNTDIDLFFDTNHGKYHGFNKLLETFEAKLPDFKTSMNSLDRNFIREISKFRELGNTNVHVLELEMSKDKSELDNNMDKLNHIIKKLIRLLFNVT